jgi:hypothetical protein
MICFDRPKCLSILSQDAELSQKQIFRRDQQAVWWQSGRSVVPPHQPLRCCPMSQMGQNRSLDELGGTSAFTLIATKSRLHVGEGPAADVEIAAAALEKMFFQEAAALL